MDDFFDMDVFELAFALGMAETIADEEIERFRIEREFEQDDDDKLFDDWTAMQTTTMGTAFRARFNLVII